MKAVELGLSLIDTAEMYAEGKAEELIGRVIRQIGKERVFVITKMLPHHLSSRDEVLKAGKMSLKRLGIDSVDLFLIHWPNTSISIENQVKNFEALVEKGYTRYIGASNFNPYELKIAMRSTKVSEIVANQVHYSVLMKEIEDELLPLAIKEDILIQAYTPLERCRVSRHSVLKRIGKTINKTPVQVALNYLISRPNVIAIPKTERMEHLKEIHSSLGWRLSPEIIEELEKL